MEEVEKIWRYGFVWKGKETTKGVENTVSEKTINYTVKYVHKVDADHRYYKSKVLCSPGIGSGYLKSTKSNDNIYLGEATKEYYTYQNGMKGRLPTYYRNNIYNDEERERLWIQMLDKNVRYVGGREISIKDTDKHYYEALAYFQRKNKRLGIS